LVIFLVFTIVGNGMATARYPWYQPWFLVGSIFGLAGSVLLYSVDELTSDARIYGYSILIGFGAGCFVTLCFSVAQTQVDKAEIPQSVAFICFAQQAGAALTLAISNTLFLNDAIRGISDILPLLPRASVQRILSGLGSDIVHSLSKVDRDKVSWAVAASLSKAYIVTIICGALAVIIALFMKRERDWEKRAKSAVDKVLGPRSQTGRGEELCR
jgi:hypothetical protein